MFAVFLSNIGCSYLKVSQVKLDTLLCEHDYKTKYILKYSGIGVIFFIIISVLFSKNSLRNWLIGSKWILCLDKYIAAELTATSLLLKYTRACIFVLCFCKTEYMMLQKSILICCYLIMMTIKKKKRNSYCGFAKLSEVSRPLLSLCIRETTVTTEDQTCKSYVMPAAQVT